MERIAIIGAGAAGCFCAIEMKRRWPDAQVTVYEAGAKPLAKVAITGGGRCNLTNTFKGIGKLGEAYPRGEKLVRHAFSILSPQETMRWWQKEGVRLTVMEDGCVFPVSQDAMQIVRTLENDMRRLGVTVLCGHKVMAVEHDAEGAPYRMTISKKGNSQALGNAAEFTVEADRVVVTTGGGALKLLEPLGLQIEKLVPSLFTFKIADEGLRRLTGTVVDNATLTLTGLTGGQGQPGQKKVKPQSHGTLLLTDWGVSGPATLKLSSYAARELSESGYKGMLLINWLSASEQEMREWIDGAAQAAPQKQVAGMHPDGLTDRLWRHIMNRAGLREDIRWAEMGSKGMARLACTLTADAYEIADRCHFKDEFVTAGGVSAKAVNPTALESREHRGLHFAGEVLDIDGISGGFNLQAAWSTAATVAREANNA